MAKWMLACGFSAVVVLGSCSDAPETSSDPASTSSTSSPVASSTTSPTTTRPTTTIAAATSSTTTVEPFEDVLLGTTPDGEFTYTLTYRGRDGIGFGFNGVITVTGADGVSRPALRDVRDEFDQIEGLAFGPDGLVAWTALDANYGAQVYVGRIGDGGLVVDLHRIPEDGSQLRSGATFDGAGRLTIPTRDGTQIHETDTDPFFVMTAETLPTIDVENPLIPVAETEGFWAGEDPGFWYRGDTLSSQSGCGGTTLYMDDADGFARVLAAESEVDRVLAVWATPLQSSVGADTVGASRGVVIAMECPEEYVGQRVVFGFESFSYGDGGPRWELPFDVAPLPIGGVDSVVAVRGVLADNGLGDDYLAEIEIDVVTLAGVAQTVTVSHN